MTESGCLLEEIRVLKAECELLMRLVSAVDDEATGILPGQEEADRIVLFDQRGRSEQISMM